MNLISIFQIMFSELIRNSEFKILNYCLLRKQGAGRKEGMTSDQHGPLTPWATHVLQWSVIKGCQPARGSQSHKPGLSSDCRLQLACMKLESLVIVNQQRHGEYVLGSCTHRPSRQESWQHQKVLGQIGNYGGVSDRDEVVTRHP